MESASGLLGVGAVNVHGAWRFSTEKVPKDATHLRQFSDTIFMFTDGVSNEELEHLLKRAKNIMCLGLAAGIPLRGAITIGELVAYATPDAIIGEAIIRAYLLEKSQDWMGVLIDEDRFAAFQRDRSHDEIWNSLTTIHEVPIKTAREAELARLRTGRPMRCLKWPKGMTHEGGRVGARKTIEQIFGNEKRKLHNTWDFYEKFS